MNRWRRLVILSLALALSVFLIQSIYSQPSGFWEEERAYQAALQYIEQHRKSDVLIKVVDEADIFLRDIAIGNQKVRSAASATAALTCSEITIYGYVKDEFGRAVSNVWIGIFDENWKQLADTRSARSGYYEFKVPKLPFYHIFFGPPHDRQIGEFRYKTYLDRTFFVRTDSATTLRQDAALRPAGTIIIKAFDKQGNMVRKKQFDEVTRNQYYATEDGILVYSRKTVAHDNYSAPNWDWNVAVPALGVMVGSTNVLNLPWEVEGFGKVLLETDNDGQSFRLTKGQVKVINLNYELARTRYRKLKEAYDKAVADGYVLPGEIKAKMGMAEQQLKAAEAAWDDVSRAAKSDQSLNNSLWASERLVLEKAQQDIEKFRKADVTIKIVDEDEKPVAGATVNFMQKTHDFLFGISDYGRWEGKNPYDARNYDLMERARVNYATVDLPWRYIEPQEGEFRWEYIDYNQNIETLARRFKLLGHALIFMSKVHLPQYLYNKTFEQLQESVRNHVLAVSSRYKDQIRTWNVNEMHGSWANELKLSVPQLIEVGKIVAKTIKEVDPMMRFMLINATPLSENIAWEIEEDNRDVYSISAYKFAEQAINASVDFDIIGLQFYYGACFKTWAGGSGCFPAIDLKTFADTLDWYSQLNKPIHITEVSVPSVYKEDWEHGYWHAPWNEQIQADWLKGFYTVAFSKPYVEAITWWDARDSGYVINGGLLRENYEPKEAYHTLKRLITEEWITDGQSVTDEQGQITFRGFAGDYIVAVTAPDGRKVEETVHVNEGQHNEFTITLPKG